MTFSALKHAAVQTAAPLGPALFLAILSLWVFTRNNDFPLDYHPDERGKVLQLIDPTHTRNFNHPLLMLEAAAAVRDWLHIDNDERANVIAGRWASAALASIAVLALAVAGYYAAGYQGLVICGSMAALCPPLNVYAHFFKEDTALVAGLAVAILGATRLIATDQRSKQGFAAALMGVGCAAALSGKYVGLATVGPCLVTICVAPGFALRPLLLRFVAFAVPAAAGVFAFNVYAFQSLVPPRLIPAALQRMGGEFIDATTGHEGLALSIPNTFSLKVSLSEMMPDVWLFLAFGMVALMARSVFDRSTVVLGFFLLTFGVVLSYSSFPFPRYALPITVLGYFVSGQLIASALRGLKQPRRFKQAMVALCLGLIVALQGTRCWRFDMQFADDSRQRLHEWAARNLPVEATILVEDYTALDGPGDPWRHPDQATIQARVLRARSAADLGKSIGQLKAAGIDYVVVAEPRYERYFRPAIHGGSFGQPEDLTEHQRFYRELFAGADLVWSSAPSPASHAYLDPQLRAYRLSNATTNALKSE
ncbi:MAG: hypothetical protein WBX30_06270 [Stellaceae bacterium]